MKQGFKHEGIWERGIGNWAGVLLLGVSLVLLSACAGDSSNADGLERPVDASSPANTGEAPAQATLSPPSIEESWLRGGHAQTFVVSEGGTNMECTPCHAPYNYLPAMDEIPEGCKTCKFEVSDPDPYVQEADWVHVDCQVCHQIKKKEVQPEVVYLEFAAAAEYGQVDSTQELCLKCHQTQPSKGHAAVVVGGAHAEMPCADCHDAHSTQASCTDAGCHEEARTGETGIPGHDSEHARVGCVTCHDGSGMRIGPSETQERWFTWLADAQGQPSRPFASHVIVLEAPCDRCHFQDNPWALVADVTSTDE